MGNVITGRLAVGRRLAGCPRNNAMTEFREVYPDILALTLPLPFELQSVNVYLVTLIDGYLLIDCGMNTEPAFETLRAAMEKRGLAWTNIRQILLTHMHPDHMGMAARLLELSGAQLAMHEVEARHLKLVTGGGRRIPWLDAVYRQAGVPQALETKTEEHFLGVRTNFDRPDPKRPFSRGANI